jgi:hypothetical protein
MHEPGARPRDVTEAVATKGDTARATEA